MGSWRFDVPNTRCHEVYRFRADGTSVVTSGAEIAESVYEVAQKPSSKGFYVWTDTIVKDNGKEDCSGQVTSVGRKVTNYIRFDRARPALRRMPRGKPRCMLRSLAAHRRQRRLIRIAGRHPMEVHDLVPIVAILAAAVTLVVVLWRLMRPHIPPPESEPEEAGADGMGGIAGALARRSRIPRLVAHHHVHLRVRAAIHLVDALKRAR